MLTGTFAELICARHFEPGVKREEFPALWTQLGYSCGAEIGVEYGYHAAYILEHWGGFLLLVDTWPDTKFGAPWYVCRQQLARFAGRFTMLRLPSIKAAALAETPSLDFVYIDATHTYEAVKADLAAWFPAIRPGGMVSGHDFGSREPNDRLGVAEAIIEFTDTHNLTLCVCQDESEWANWYFLK